MAAKAAALLLLSVCVVAAAAAGDDGGGGLTKSKFKVYWHDVFGTTPTAIRVAQAASTNSSSTSFGAVVAIDDPLTSSPAPSGARGSKDEVGRAQGTYTFADQATYGLLMNMNFVFTAGEHKGSGLSIFGRNEVLSEVREMSVIGGTGKFRMARGYVEARTVDSGAKSGESIVEYTVYVDKA